MLSQLLRSWPATAVRTRQRDLDHDIDSTREGPEREAQASGNTCASKFVD